MPPILDITEDPASIDSKSTCLICLEYFFLPIVWGPCGHTFCLTCVWDELAIQTGRIRYSMCRSEDYEFLASNNMAAYMEFHNVQSSHSQEERGTIKL